MSYFLLKQPRRVKAGATQTGNIRDAVITHEAERVSEFDGIDFIEDGSFVSDRMKKLIEMFMPHNEWVLHVSVFRG